MNRGARSAGQRVGQSVAAGIVRRRFIDDGSTVISDAIPANSQLFVGDLTGSGSGPVEFVEGAPPSGLLYAYAGLSDPADGLEFSNNNGLSFDYIPVPNGSVVDMTVWFKRDVTAERINDVVRSAAAGPYRGILEYSADPIVSSDMNHSRYSSTFDSMATMVLGDKVSKTLSWYDNGFGYAHRVVDLVKTMARLDREAA